MRAVIGVLALVMGLAEPAAGLWSPVNEPGQGDGIEVLAAGDDALYAGTFRGFVFSSQDHGSTWALVAEGLPDSPWAPVGSVVQAGDWLVVSRESDADRNYRSARVGGVWQTWQPLAFQDDSLSNLRAQGGMLFASIGGRPYRSSDMGDTWTPLADPAGAYLYRVFPAGPYLIGVEDQINSGGIFRSEDDGETWIEITGPITSSYLCAMTVFDGELLLSVYHYGGVGTLWRSPDWGAGWLQVTNLPSGWRNLNGLAVSGSLLALGASGETDGQTVFLTWDLVSYQPYTGDLPPFARPVNELLVQDGWLFKSGGSVTHYRAPLPTLIFGDGFEVGDTSAWSGAVP